MRPEDTKIGLEIHVPLGTPFVKYDEGGLYTKLFCECPVLGRKAAPNSSVCPICTGIPGSIPVIQKRACRMAVRLCRVLGCKVARTLLFDRKRYFYQDLPRSYQITQITYPVGSAGYLGSVPIERIQIEEDPARFEGKVVDYNRCGKMLVQIVTAPVLHSAAQAVHTVAKLLGLMALGGVIDQSAETLFRADVNVSSKTGNRWHPRVELKNIGSLKQIGEAIEAELARQTTSTDTHIHTRYFEPAFGKTVYSRSKETFDQYSPLAQCNIPPIDTSAFSPLVHQRCPPCLGSTPLTQTEEKTLQRMRGWARIPGCLDYTFFSRAKAHFIDMLLAEAKYRGLSFLQFSWTTVEPWVVAGDRLKLRAYLDRIKEKSY